MTCAGDPMRSHEGPLAGMPVELGEPVEDWLQLGDERLALNPPVGLG
jgi:hypothetical protein